MSTSFNWVLARSKCSLAHMFNSLIEMIESDVEAANRLKFKDVTFKVTHICDTRITVARLRDYYIPGGAQPDAVVAIEIEGTNIRFRDGMERERVLFHATPSLNEEGECVLMVEGKPYKLWQIRQKALEPVFFS